MTVDLTIVVPVALLLLTWLVFGILWARQSSEIEKLRHRVRHLTTIDSQLRTCERKIKNTREVTKMVKAKQDGMRENINDNCRAIQQLARKAGVTLGAD